MNNKSKMHISEEVIEDIRMTTGFDRDEIKRLYKKFYVITDDKDQMKKTDFQSIECLGVSPLFNQVSAIFGFSDVNKTINVKQFIVGISKFNCPLIESREQKIKIAFRLQDIDGDGVISKSDIMSYLQIVTKKKLEKYEREEIAQHMLEECSTHPMKEIITFNDFHRVVGSTDFQTKLHLPI